MSYDLGANSFWFTSSRKELAAMVYTLDTYDSALFSFQRFAQDHVLDVGPEWQAYREQLSKFLNAVLAGDELRTAARAALISERVTPSPAPADTDADAWKLTYTIDTKKLPKVLDAIKTQFDAMNRAFERCVAIVAASKGLEPLPPTLPDNGPSWSKIWEDESLDKRVSTNAKKLAKSAGETVSSIGGVALGTGAIVAMGVGLFLLARFSK
jgi:hypothetical protein